MKTSFVVFSRPVGSLCWLIERQDGKDGLELGHVAQFHTLDLAHEFAAYVQKHRRGWHKGKPNVQKMQAWVCACELPE